MEKTITLNEQQLQWLKEQLKYNLEHFTGKTGQAICKLILDKLNEE